MTSFAVPRESWWASRWRNRSTARWIAFDPDSGVVTIDVNEGTIDGVEFQGVDEKLARRFASEFALRAGDVFNRERAQHALDALLQQTRGAIRPGRLYGDGSTFTPTRDMRRR